MKPILTDYIIPIRFLPESFTFLVVSDLHNSDFEPVLPLLEAADALLIPGDVADRYRNTTERGIAFLRESAARLPVFLSPGNHDLSVDPFRPFWKALLGSGVTVLYNTWTEWKGLALGGVFLATPHSAMQRGLQGLSGFVASDKPKILLCHRPEDAWKPEAGRTADLVISGHAHGGQIRIAGRGLYAPGQGTFPKLTRGQYAPNLLVSAGYGNPAGVPRWGNPPEILRVKLVPAEN